MDSRSTSNPFPGFERIYKLSDPVSARFFRARVELSSESAFAITRGEVRPAEVVVAKWSKGSSRPADVIWTTLVAPILVSDRVVSLLSDRGFRGWSSYQVRLVGKRGEEIEGYSGLAIHGRCGPIDDAKSVEVPQIYPGGVFPAWKGLYFDARTWDGSDVFLPADGTRRILVVEAVKRAFAEARVKNVAFNPLPEVDRPDLEIGKDPDRK